jgi:hypothetical protein
MSIHKHIKLLNVICLNFIILIVVVPYVLFDKCHSAHSHRAKQQLKSTEQKSGANQGPML